MRWTEDRMPAKRVQILCTYYVNAVQNVLNSPDKFCNFKNALAPSLLGVDATNKNKKVPHHHNKHAGSNGNAIIGI